MATSAQASKPECQCPPCTAEFLWTLPGSQLQPAAPRQHPPGKGRENKASRVCSVALPSGVRGVPQKQESHSLPVCLSTLTQELAWHLWQSSGPQRECKRTSRGLQSSRGLLHVSYVAS